MAVNTPSDQPPASQPPPATPHTTTLPKPAAKFDAKPNLLLAQLEREEECERRGKLKIFLGMSAGVGKTYAMLQEAQERRKEGADVVVGYVETHKREGTLALVEGLEVVPRKHLEYRGVMMEEMDLDAVLARAPQIALVDELAHTNITGSRHLKRFQDVQELLDAGIDVFTTVNVQHLESRTDTVMQITGVEVRETVPDSIIEEADDIELVDIAPDELLKRLAEGKIYTSDRAEEAAKNFFRKGNLTALREMALRLAAERVDQELRDYKQEKNIEETWKSGERLMVAVGPSPFSEPLVRWTRRMAYSMDASWIALSVQTSKPLNEAGQARLNHNLELARELGAEILYTTDENLVSGILRVARQENVSQIVIGKPPKRSLWTRLKDAAAGGSVVDRLIQESGTIDVYAVRVEAKREEAKPPQEQPVWIPQAQSGVKDYVATTMITAFAGLLCFVLYEAQILTYQAVGVLLLFTTTLMALAFGRGPVLLAAVAGAGFWNYFFIPPVFTWAIEKLEDILTLVLYVLVAVVSGALTSRTRTQQRAVRQREERSAALHGLAQDLAAAATQNDVLYAAVQHFAETLNAEIAIFLASEDEAGAEHLDTRAHRLSSFTPTLKEESVALWAFTNRRHAGKFTDTLSSAQAYYVPMISPRGVVGVIGVRFTMAGMLTVEQQTLIESFVSQITSALEREILNESAKQAEIVAESERLQTTLLNSISHELRTPLAIINTASTALQDEKTSASPEARHALSGELQEAVGRMNHLVENLIGMTRLETGHLQLHEQWCDVRDVFNSVTTFLKRELAAHPTSITVAPKTPLVKVDAGLMQQALINIAHNAALYTPTGAAIELNAELRGAKIALEIVDNGRGVAENVLEHLFDKFYRLPDSPAGGTGLGLAISKGIIEAHKGSIAVNNRVGGGLKFTILLPYQPAPSVYESQAAERS